MIMCRIVAVIAVTATCSAAAKAASAPLLSTAAAYADLFSFPKIQVLFGTLPRSSVIDYSPITPATVATIDETDPSVLIMPVAGGDSYVCHIPEASTYDPKHTSLPHHPDVPETSPQHRTSIGLFLLEPLKTSCMYFPSGWWTYELCHTHTVRQFHAMTAAEQKTHPPGTKIEFSLGVYEPGSASVAEIEVDGRVMNVVRMNYVGGTECDVMDAGSRRTVVQYQCGAYINDFVAGVRETGSCRYEVTVLTRRLCEDPNFAPRRIDNAQSIVCERVLAIPGSTLSLPQPDSPWINTKDLIGRASWTPPPADLVESETLVGARRMLSSTRSAHSLAGTRDFRGEFVVGGAADGATAAAATGFGVDKGVAAVTDLNAMLLKIMSQALKTNHENNNEAKVTFAEGKAVKLDEAVKEIQRRMGGEVEVVFDVIQGGDVAEAAAAAFAKLNANRGVRADGKKKGKKGRKDGKKSKVAGAETAAAAAAVPVAAEDDTEGYWKAWVDRFQGATADEQDRMLDEAISGGAGAHHATTVVADKKEDTGEQAQDTYVSPDDLDD